MIYSEPLQYFVEVIRCGSFSRAAKKLGLATSTVTKSLTALEHDLNKVLMKRLKSGVELTDVGRELYESIVDSYMIIENAVSRVKHNKESIKKSIKIITTTGMTSLWLMPRLRGFIEKYPDVNILIETTNKSIALSKTDADVALLPTIDDPGLVVKKKIYSFEMRLLASPKYLEKYGVPKSFEDLKDHKLIGFYLTKNNFNGNVDWHLKSGGQILEPSLVVNSAMCVFYATVLGYGISVTGADFSFDAGLVTILPDLPPPSVDVFFFASKKNAGAKMINDLFYALSEIFLTKTKITL